MIDELLKATREERWPDATKLLYRHWISASQTVYPAQIERPWECAIDEEQITAKLLHPLAVMFCADLAVPTDASLGRLKEIVDIDESTARSGQICGKMFSNGEPNYSCKECATDGTCVLCYECFTNSAHMNHKYKIHASLGSGYCDCGDKEAWSNDYACKLHMPKAEDVEKETDGMGLPPQIVNRLHHLSLITLKFVVNLLCWDRTENFHSIIEEEFISTELEAFQTILFNDETHTYEGVIRALELAIACSANQAMRLSTIVDKEGRAIVRTGTKDICETVKQSIERRTQKDSNRRTQKSGPLVVKVFRSSLSGLQSLAVHLLAWLGSQAQEFPPLGPIICEALLYGCPSCDKVSPLGRAKKGELAPICGCEEYSNAVFLMLFDKKLWKAARVAFHKLLMSTVLMDLDYKNIFGRLFVQNYGVIFDDFIEDDHEHNVSVTSMTVQIFTVPTVARRLIMEEDAISILMGHLCRFCERYMLVSPHNDQLVQMDFSNDSYPAVLKRALYILNDIGYLLTIAPKENEWTPELRQKFLNGSKAFLNYLATIQGMDTIKRQSLEHQLMESEWETAFNIFLRLQEPISLLLTWARTDPIVHVELYTLAMAQIVSKTDKMPEFKVDRVKVQVNGHQAYCIQFEVAKGTISVHQPLWRFIGGLFCSSETILSHYHVTDEFHQQQNEQFLTDDQPRRVNMKGVRTLLMEMSLRVLVLNAQAGAAQLWRRNGFSLVNQLHNYSSNLCRTEMFDRDIHLLQVIGALMDPNKFLVRILDRFGLAKWAEIGFEDVSQPVGTIFAMDGTSLDESSKIFIVLAEEMFHLLIMLIAERYTPGLSPDATPQKMLEREIIHILCTGPKPFSQVEKFIPNDPSIQRLSLADTVRNMSDFKRPTAVSTGQFYLKESLMPEYNPFFWHYSKYLASMAEQQQKKERSRLTRELKACPPPIPPSFSPFFAPLLRIMESDLFVKLLRIVFERLNKRSRFVSDGVFYRALYLTAMALNEQQKAYSEGKQFAFLQRAQKEGIFETLSRLQDKPEVETHNDLLWWTLKTYSQIAGHSSARTGGLLPVNETDITRKERGGAAERAAIGARKRQLALERMRQLQNSFKTQHLSLADSTSAAEAQQHMAATIGFDENEPSVLFPDSGFPICCGIKKSSVELRPLQMTICVLCQEDECISFDGNPIVCSAFVQNSRLFSPNCKQGRAELFDTSGGEILNIFSPIDVPSELHISTCSHLMHFKCYNTFIDAQLSRERNRPRTHLNSRMLNPQFNEFFCPLCKRLSNCVLPMFPPVQLLHPDVKGFSEKEDSSSLADESFGCWIAALSALVIPPLSSPPKSIKGHNRKRSHSERSLADLAKTAAAVSSQQVDLAVLSGPLSSGVSPSSIASLPSSFEGIPAIEEGQRQMGNARSSSSVSSSMSVSDAISGQMLNDSGSSVIVQQLLTYVFGGKKLSPKGMNQTNLPSSIPHWNTMKPLLSTLEKVRSPDSADLYLNNVTFDRYSELINVLKTCSFLVRSIAAVLEAENKPLFGAFNTRQRDCLNAFVRLSLLAPFNCHPSGLRALLTRLLSPLLAPQSADDDQQQQISGASSSAKMHKISPLRLLHPHLDQALRGDATIMQIDMLTLAVELVMCIGWRNAADLMHKVADGSIDELYVIRLTLLAHLFQVIELFEPELAVASDDELFGASSSSAENKKDQTHTNQFMARVRQLFPERRMKFTVESQLTLLNLLHSSVIAFLRPLAILYSAITLVPPPESLKDPSVDTLIPLCRYLGLPSNIMELFAGQEVERFFQMWSRHPTSTARPLPSSYQPVVHLPLKLNSLINLPSDFSELIKMAVNFRCPQVDEFTSTIPTLCLICGELLCSQSYCCQRTINNKNVGACTYHLMSCHNNSGIFMRIRECQIIFMFIVGEISRGCFKPAPYVDEFGETDPGFRRGNPMHLNKELYWKIRRQWMYQEVAEEVINQYELNHRNIAFEWQHF